MARCTGRGGRIEGFPLAIGTATLVGVIALEEITVVKGGLQSTPKVSDSTDLTGKRRHTLHDHRSDIDALPVEVVVTNLIFLRVLGMYWLAACITDRKLCLYRLHSSSAHLASHYPELPQQG